MSFIAVAIIASIAFAAIANMLAPRPTFDKPKAAGFGDLNFPRSEEGDPVPWIIGTVRLSSPVVLWYGDFSATANTKRVKVGKDWKFDNKYKDVVTGYSYKVGFDLAWCLGGEYQAHLRRLWWGKKIILDIAQTNSKRLPVNTFGVDLPKLLGGPENGGGIGGTITSYEGLMTQPIDEYVKVSVNQHLKYLLAVGVVEPLAVPAYNGVAHTVFGNAFYIGDSPGLDAISAEFSRFTNYLGDSNLAQMGLDVNPVEALLASMLDKKFMSGISILDIHIGSFIEAAAILKQEELGVSAKIESNISWGQFAQSILSVMDAMMYQSDENGRIVLKLIRDDFDVNNLKTIDEFSIIKFRNFKKTTWEQTINQVRYNFKNREKEYQSCSVTAQDFANMNYQRTIKDRNTSDGVVFTEAVAKKLANRALSFSNIPVFSVTIETDRSASFLNPGDVFRLSYPDYGINGAVMRVQSIDRGDIENGTVTIDAIQDVFSVNKNVFGESGEKDVPVFSAEPEDVTIYKIIEAPFQLADFDDASEANSLSKLMVLANAPTKHSEFIDVAKKDRVGQWESDLEFIRYSVKTSLTSAFNDGVKEGFSAGGFGVLGATFDNVLTDEGMDNEGAFDAGLGMLLLVDDEIMQPAKMVVDNGLIYFSDVYRGLLGTKIAEHSQGADVWFIINRFNIIDDVFGNNTQAELRLLDKTYKGTMPITDVDSVYFTPTGVQAKPDGPTYIKIDGDRYDANDIKEYDEGDEVALTWYSRNRQDIPVPYNSSHSTSEPGQTHVYTYKVGSGEWSEQAATTSLTELLFDTTGKVGTITVRVFSLLNQKVSIAYEECSFIVNEYP